MKTYYYALDIRGDYVFDNFPENLKYLVSEFQGSSKPFYIIDGEEKKLARMGCKKNNYGTVYTLTTEKKYIDRYKLFKELIELSIISLKPITDLQKKIIHDSSSQNEEFIHNVISLNTYSIQSLFSLIPQGSLTENINKQKDFVRSIISEKPNVTVRTLLSLIKYSLAIKVEFSVFERTLKPSAFVQKTEHSIRAIILSILQIFIDDFEKNEIDVSLDACEKYLSVDYDSLFVSLYYLLDNSIKYCCPKTKYKIIFKEEKTCFSVLFIMVSIKIQTGEVVKLTTRGYRSELAKLLNKDGHGIGMYRILKTLNLNDAELEITPRVAEYTRQFKNIEYECNQFKIKFMGQQDWFIVG